MSLTPGTRLGSYEVLGPLGAGGMGEVFRARDTRLGREVALKLLPEDVARDPARLSRLEHEARILASLQHPHVATLFAFEEEEGRRFLAMELVPGETLAERLTRGPLPLREALTLARQVAEGLEAAHERGIVHLDLKPANVKITPEGKAKVLDFGVARPADRSPSPLTSQMPTATAAAFPPGFSGTAAYMSPEQVRGQPLDRRADVWAFGATLYEALAGRRAFAGATMSDVLVQVLERDPDWSALPEGTPGSVRQLLRLCLKKDLAERLRDVADARLLIEEALSAPPASPVPRRERRRWLGWGLGALGLLAAGSLGALAWRAGAGAPRPVRRFQLDVQADGMPSISPDGKRIAFVEKDRLRIRDLDRLETREVPGSDRAALPFWSPDGSAVAFVAAGVLKRAPAEGGPARTICTLKPAGVFAGGAWSPGGEIVVALAPAQGLFEVSAEGGEMKPFLKPDAAKGVFDYHSPRFLPDGRTLLLTVHPQSGWQLYVALFDGRDLLRLSPESYSPVGLASYSGSGLLLFDRLEQRRSVYAMPFSLSGRRATGEPILVAEDGGSPSLSDDETLVYVQGGVPRFDLALVDRAGRLERVLSPGLGIIRFPRFSPDGKRLLLDASGEGHIEPWVYDLERGTRARLTSGPSVDVAGAWSSSGDRVAVMSGLFSDSSVAILRADGTGEVERLPFRADALPEGAEVSPDWSPDGRYVVFRSAGDLYYGDLSDRRTARAFVRSPFTESEPRFSPDGRYVAYMSNESGRFEVYVRPFPAGDGKWAVSTNGGTLPRWSRRGDELFYVEGRTLMALTVSTRPGFRAGAPWRLFDGTAVGVGLWSFSPLIASYDPLPDGRGFVVARPAAGPPASLVVVENWAEELKRRR
jgi:Tol biopolymer transport system component/predicted Ser/Thr protein kinase